MRRAWRAVIACAVAIVPALLNAASGAAEAVYPQVTPGHRIELPRDAGSHPSFRIEWWYLTGWLEDEAGEQIGFQVTFFRNRPAAGEDNPSRFAPRQLLFAHAALSDPKRGRLMHAEKAARAGFGLAEAAEGALDVHIDDWSLRQERGGELRAVVEAGELGIEIEARETQPPLLQGDAGYSRKGPAAQAASYYYSLPHLEVRGRVRLDGRERQVQGVAWFDHEWSSEIMDEAAQGWDWVGLNLDGGGALMAFRMRERDGGTQWASATLRPAPGAPAVTYRPGQIEWRALRAWRSPRTGIRYPLEWSIKIGERTLTLRPLMDDQENDARGSTGTLYWEGAVRAFDETGRAIGRGYLELTGYGSRMPL